jgi:uncharacterized protein (DUF305 family)
MNRFNTLLAAIVLAAMASPAMAQAPMPGMQMASDPSPSTSGFKAADEKMMKAMDRPMTGNADQDFVAGMLPHHVGAVDMANIEIRYGKDREMLRLARAIIAAQEKEIAQMQAWQKKHSTP